MLAAQAWTHGEYRMSSQRKASSASGAVAVLLIVVVLWMLAQKDVPDVFVFGDSLSFQSTGNIQDLLSANHLEGKVVSKPGARIGDALPWVREEVAGKRPKAVVIALGTNDALLDAERFRQEWPAITMQIDGILQLAEDARCVVWVAPVLARGSDQTNQVTEWVRQKGEAVHILDWPAIAQQHADVFSGDGVHYTEAGQLRFADAIVREGVQRLCGAALSP
jgi:lysophospholipase L1-like esterase